MHHFRYMVPSFVFSLKCLFVLLSNRTNWEQIVRGTRNTWNRFTSSRVLSMKEFKEKEGVKVAVVRSHRAEAGGFAHIHEKPIRLKPLQNACV